MARAYNLFNLNIFIYPNMSTFPFQILKKIRLFTLTYYTLEFSTRTDQREDTLNLCSGIIMRRSGAENRPALHLSSFVWRKDVSFVNATSATMTLRQVFLFLQRLFFTFLFCVSFYSRIKFSCGS